MPESPAPRYLVSPTHVSRAFLFGGIGLVAMVVGVLLLATARPQGTFVRVDDSQHQAQLRAAEAALTGYELVGDGARIDIGSAMQLIVERGVAQPIHAGGAAPAAAAADDGGIAAQAAPDGAALYTQHCSACHQATGAGIPGAFPPIADHLYELVAVDRAFPAKVVLFGMMGTIQVKGATYMGMMPGLAMAMSDADVAAVLNHAMTAWGDDAKLGDAFEPYTADEVAEWRALGLDFNAVHALRVELGLP